ncbi:hypothetical protein AC579_2888 [Pseudocercospora musae]|uniref:F-box domain-containing protein n=1 Tax=Pseudocercospora musae TaxID=113226 RepID=A0A139IUM8_9PEZI|nr:hypothetical protein AC579_2888 [Pseudocercospora musae]
MARQLPSRNWAASPPLHSCPLILSTPLEHCLSLFDATLTADLSYLREASMPGYGEVNARLESTFLGLPHEMRAIIYEYLLDQKRQHPVDPAHAGPRNPNSPISGQTIHFEAKSPKPALLRLKLCCRQILEEVRGILRLHQVDVGAGQARLDIMIEGSSIWPTWILLPVNPHLNPVIQVDLRIFEVTGFGNEFSTGAYRALWSLFNLLVFNGPCFIYNKELRRPLAIERLRFDIMMCFPTSADDLFGTYKDVFHQLERLAYDNVGLGHISSIEACLGADRRAWKLKQLPTGLTFAMKDPATYFERTGSTSPKRERLPTMVEHL